jgi:hypothetical protein
MTQIQKIKRPLKICCSIVTSKSKIIVPAKRVKTGFGDWLLGFEICLQFGA